jgi:hypothetical protein
MVVASCHPYKIKSKAYSVFRSVEQQHKKTMQLVLHREAAETTEGKHQSQAACSAK